MVTGFLTIIGIITCATYAILILCVCVSIIAECWNDKQRKRLHDKLMEKDREIERLKAGKKYTIPKTYTGNTESTL